MSFADLKKRRQEQAEKVSAGFETKSYNDDTFWQPTVDKKLGTGIFVFRYLPAKEGEDIPYVEQHSHSYQGPGGWYIEKCPTDLKQECPQCKGNTVLWETGLTENQNIVRSRKRQKNYISNIFIIQDKSNPENQGKVFKYKFGPKILEKIRLAIKPEFDDVEALNPFDLWEGADFTLRIKKNIQGYRDYSDSSFGKAKPLFVTKNGEPDEKKMEIVYQQVHSLANIVAPNQYKSYDELEKRYNKILGITDTKKPVNRGAKPAPTAKAIELNEDDLPPFDEDEPVKVSNLESDEFDDFASLANED